MTKRTVTRIWLVGLIVLVAGLIIGGVSLGLLLAYGGHWTPTGANNYTFNPTIDGYFWTMIWLMIGGFSLLAIGGIAQLVAWIGALITTYQLADKTWFTVLLVGGVLGLSFGLLGFAVMVAYLLAGPDEMRIEQAPRIERPPRVATLAPAT